MAVPGPRQDGFTLIELAIGLAILVTLTVILVNSYQTYTVRGQVEAGIPLAEGLKPKVLEHLRTRLTVPTNRADAGLSANGADTFNDYVKSITIVNGRLDITYGNDASPQIADAVLSITPYEAPDNSIIWRCGRAKVPTDATGSELTPAGTSGTGNKAFYEPGSVPKRFYPASCR